MEALGDCLGLQRVLANQVRGEYLAGGLGQLPAGARGAPSEEALVRIDADECLVIAPPGRMLVSVLWVA